MNFMPSSRMREDNAAEPQCGSFSILRRSSLSADTTAKASTESQKPSICKALVSHRLNAMKTAAANASAISSEIINLFAEIITGNTGKAEITQIRAPVRGKKAGMILHSLFSGLKAGVGIRDKKLNDRANDLKIVFISAFIILFSDLKKFTSNIMSVKKSES